MIDSLNHFTTTLICTVMMAMLIKMIIPDGKNKKYILFVCGIITSLVLLEPLLSFMNLDINEVLAKNEEQYEEYKVDENLYKETVQDSYDKKMITDVINRLKENGYNVDNVKIEYDSFYRPIKMYLDLEDGEGYVQPVKIEVAQNSTSSNISEMTKSKIQEIIKSNYGIEKNNILIGRSSK